MSSDENDIAIRVANLSKCYEIYSAPRDRLKQFFMPYLQRLFRCAPKQYFREFWAIKNISLEIKKGESVGIVGRNGSGKSTFLQMICGTLTPTSGTIQINGRVAALLELGSGFNPEFTGRENVYMNASVLGLSKLEIDACFDDIILFADIGDFVDRPVKTYSSGMYVRLAFAVIAHVNADILVVDEALAVGDVFFQQKCMRYLREFQKNSGTVIFVSHDTSAIVNLCEKAMLLSSGRDAVVDTTDKICRLYIQDVYDDRENLADQKNMQDDTSVQVISKSKNIPSVDFYDGAEQVENLIRATSFRAESESFGKKGAEIVDTWFENENDEPVSTLFGGRPVKLCIKAAIFQDMVAPAFGFMLKDRLGQYIFAEGTDLAYRDRCLLFKSGEVVVTKFSFLMPILIEGEYALNVAIADGAGDDHIQHHWINDVLVLHSLKSRLVHGICGVHQLSIKMAVSPHLGAE